MADVRYFSWDQPFLPAAASALAREWEGERGVDLSDTLVVVPGARAGRRFLELLLEAASDRHRRLIPPARIMTIGSLPEELYEPHSPISSPVATRRAWTMGLEATPSPVRETALGPMARGEMEPGVVLGFSRLLDSLHRTVGAAGLDFGAVARECREGFLFSDEERWTALSRVQARMRQILGSAGLIDREEARLEALARGAIRSHRTLILLGVAQLPRLTRKMVANLDGPVTALVHAPETERDAFDTLGLLRASAWQDREVPVPDHDLTVVEGPRDQAQHVRACLQERFGQLSLDQVSVGVPDPSLVPYLARELRSAGYPTRYAEGDPVSSSPPVLLLRAVSDYLTSGRFRALEDLLRHPDLPHLVRPELAPEMADGYFQDRLPDRLPAMDGEGPSSGEGLTRVRSLLHGPALLGRFQGKRPSSEWMPEILAFLAEAYEDLRPEADPVHFRSVAESATQLRSAAEAIHQLPQPLDEPCSPTRAIQLLLSEVKDGRIPPQQDESAVEMVGWLELQLDDAPVVLLTGVCDPFLPESVNADPFLPNAIRSRIGIEDNARRYARDAYRLTALLNSTRDRVLVAGRTTSSGDPIRPSRLLLTASGEPLARRVLRLTGKETDGPGEAQIASEGRHAGGDEAQLGPHLLPSDPPAEAGRSGFVLPPQPFIPIKEIPHPLPVTAFRTLLHDPYLWAVQAVLGLRAVEYDLHELDPPSFGTVAHGVLEAFAESEEAGSSDPRQIEERLFQALEDTANERFGPHPLPAVPIQLEQLRHRLQRFARWQARWRAQGWEILCAEARTAPGGVPLDVDGEPVYLSGRVDRIDRNRETGAWALLDYKTGDSGVSVAKVRDRKGNWKDLQLPLYRRLVEDLRTPQGDPLAPPPPGTEVYVGYLHLPRGDTPVEEDLAEWDEGVLESAYETARRVIRELRRDGGVHFRPGESGRGSKGDLGAFLGQGFLETMDDEGEP